jgi:predicted hydrolase (HD superfamily)
MPELSHNLGRKRFGNPANRGNVPTKDEALALLNAWVSNERLRLHMKQVGELMGAWAVEKENADDQTALKWEVAGLLHDADWEKYPDQHCRVIIEELENRAVDPEIIQCIASHGPRYFGVEPETMMDKMIYVFDELSGFIHAAALIRPARYEGMDEKSILKKLKTPSFAAQVSREDIYDAIARAQLDLNDIIAFIIPRQQTIS